MSFSTEINLGNVIAAASVIVTLFTLHKSNVHRIIKQAEDLAEIKTKVNAMWDRFIGE